MQDKYSEEFGKRLRQVLEKRGLSRQRAAEVLGCSKVTVGTWAKGDVPFAVEILERIGREYNVDLNWLVLGKRKGAKTK